SRRRHTRLVSDWSSDVCSSDLDVLADAPWLPGVVELVLAGVGMTDEGIRRLTERPASGALARLDLAHNAVTVAGADLLLAWPGRSEERRVGEECRARGRAGDVK